MTICFAFVLPVMTDCHSNARDHIFVAKDLELVSAKLNSFSLQESLTVQ